MTKQRIGLYPGTFDPVTKGHYDIIKRAGKLVDKLVVGVAVNAGKGPLFSLEERVEMVREEIGPLMPGATQFEVKPFSNLLMHFAMEIGAVMIIRGLRAVSDFEYEFQMVGMNARLNSDIETVFLMASDNHQFIASRLVKEIAMLGGDINPFVSPRVAERLRGRVREAHGAVGADHHDAVGERVEDRREAVALGAQSIEGLAQGGAHRLEGDAEVGDLVAPARDLDRLVEVALGDPTGGLGEALDARGDRARDQEADQDRCRRVPPGNRSECGFTGCSQNTLTRGSPR